MMVAMTAGGEEERERDRRGGVSVVLVGMIATSIKKEANESTLA